MNPSGRSLSNAERQLFQHLLEITRSESSLDVIERYETLFLVGHHYPEPDILDALSCIVQSEFADRDFHLILNRCCFIAVNNWYYSSWRKNFIPELIGIFADLPDLPASASLTLQWQRQLVQQFSRSAEYQALQKLAAVIEDEQGVEATTASAETPLEIFRPRYPFIYEQTLATEAVSWDHLEMVRTMRQKAQKRQEILLNRYVAHRERLHLHTSQPDPALVRQYNPTLLDNQTIDEALQAFVGKVDGSNTCRDLAQHFRANCRWARSLHDLKRDLYEYLIPAVSADYSRHAFARKLSQCLAQTLSQYDVDPPNEGLFRKLCRALLDFLVVESPWHRDCSTFMDLHGYLGPIPTVGLLLRILLVAANVKTYLEGKLAILFDTYANHTRQQMKWFIDILETVNIALCMNFPCPTVGA